MIDAGWATLDELERWTHLDVVKANEVLDAIAEARAVAEARARTR